MERIILALIFLLTPAQLWAFGVMMGSDSVVGACTTPTTGDEFNEGWVGSGEENAASSSDTIGSGETINDDYTLTGSPLTGSCAEGLLVSTTSGNTTYRMIDLGSAIASTVDIYFEFKVASVTLPADNDQFRWFGLNDVGNVLDGDVEWWVMYRQSGTNKIFEAADGLSEIATIDTSWHKLQIHLDSTAANSYTKYDSDSNVTFTYNGNNLRYLFFGPASIFDADENVSIEWGRVWVNTP